MSKKLLHETSLLDDLKKRTIKNDHDCWIWQGAYCGPRRSKYPNTRFGKAHRLMYSLVKGHIPERMFVCHHCDNPKCINPDHLFVGTQTDNMNDCKRKGRMSMPPTGIGEVNGRAKLTRSDVGIIRLLLSYGIDKKKLAKSFGVTVENIHHIAKGSTWRLPVQDDQARQG